MSDLFTGKSGEPPTPRELAEIIESLSDNDLLSLINQIFDIRSLEMFILFGRMSFRKLKEERRNSEEILEDYIEENGINPVFLFNAALSFVDLNTLEKVLNMADQVMVIKREEEAIILGYLNFAEHSSEVDFYINKVGQYIAKILSDPNNRKGMEITEEEIQETIAKDLAHIEADKEYKKEVIEEFGLEYEQTYIIDFNKKDLGNVDPNKISQYINTHGGGQYIDLFIMLMTLMSQKELLSLFYGWSEDSDGVSKWDDITLEEKKVILDPVLLAEFFYDIFDHLEDEDSFARGVKRFAKTLKRSELMTLISTVDNI